MCLLEVWKIPKNHCCLGMNLNSVSTESLTVEDKMLFMIYWIFLVINSAAGDDDYDEGDNVCNYWPRHDTLPWDERYELTFFKPLDYDVHFFLPSQQEGVTGSYINGSEIFLGSSDALLDPILRLAKIRIQ